MSMIIGFKKLQVLLLFVLLSSCAQNSDFDNQLSISKREISSLNNPIAEKYLQELLKVKKIILKPKNNMVFDVKANNSYICLRNYGHYTELYEMEKRCLSDDYTYFGINWFYGKTKYVFYKHKIYTFILRSYDKTIQGFGHKIIYVSDQNDSDFKGIAITSLGISHLKEQLGTLFDFALEL